MPHWMKWMLIFMTLGFGVSWIVYRSSYLADVQYAYYREGMVTTIDFKTGQQWVEPIEQYCQSENKEIIWLKEESQNDQVLYSVYLTKADGKTMYQFNTQQLFEQVGVDEITDICYTSEDRVIFIAGNSKSTKYRLYEFRNGRFIPLYDGAVYWSLSLQNEELLFTALSKDDIFYSTTRIMALNLRDNSVVVVDEGYNASRLDQNTLIMTPGKFCDFRGLVKKNMLTGQEILLDAPYFDCPSGKINSNNTSIISQYQNYGLIYYYGSVGADSESPMVGLHDFNKNRTINVDRYFRTVLLKKPPQLGWLDPSSHVMNVLLESQ